MIIDIIDFLIGFVLAAIVYAIVVYTKPIRKSIISMIIINPYYYLLIIYKNILQIQL